MRSIIKIKCILLILLLSLICTSCGSLFYGYSYSIEGARKKESFYDEYDYIFTIEQETRAVDFLICGEYIRILKFDCKYEYDRKVYNIKSRSTFFIKENLTYDEEPGEDTWGKSGNWPFQVEWIITTKNIDDAQGYFNFIYNDIECILSYRIID